jgi:hypothetical protein
VSAKENFEFVALEVLNFLYYATILPFVFYNLFKGVSRLFVSPKLVKNATEFTDAQKEDFVNQNDGITVNQEAGIAGGSNKKQLLVEQAKTTNRALYQ